MRKDWINTELKVIAPYWVEKVDSEKLNSDNFISADNMLPDKGGITNSNYVPTSGKATSFNPGDVLVSNIRPYFKKIWFAKNSGGCSNDVIVFKTNPEIADPRFVYYCLSKDDFFDFMMAGANGTKMPRGNKQSIPQYKLELPPLPTQRKIASILSAYDNLIENNLKRIKLLEEKAQLTYEEWFVRMKYPGHETTPINEESGLPKGWEMRKIAYACKISGGGTPSKSIPEYWNNGNITWFSPTDLSKSKSLCLLESENKISDLGLQKSSAKLLGPDSFMMSSRATIGLFGLMETPFSTNQGFINITPNASHDKEFLLYNFITRIDEFKGYATGSTFPELSKGKFKELDIIWPTEQIRKLFNELVYSIHFLLFNLTKQNKLLTEARDILLPRLMTGMIDVDSIDIKIPEAANT